MIVDNKMDMARHLADAMFSSYDRYRSEQKLEPDTGLLKTYFIEAHVDIDEKSPNDTISTFLDQLKPYLRIQVSKSQDETLFNVVHGKDIYYLDISDPRFWIIHTLALSTRADRLRAELIKSSPLLDSAWLPAQFLERIATFGHFRGFGAIHDETPLLIDKTAETEIESMHLRLWGGSAATVLESMKASKALKHSLALSSIRLKYWLPNYEDEAITDNFTFDGKVTALGKSFISHTNLVSKVHSDYVRTIRSIEEEFPIQFVPKDGIPTLEGHPIIISLTRELADLSSFISRVFSSALPFRLWGLPEIIEDDFARVYAVDLHIGHKLLFEIAKGFIRIYLPAGTCGNTIARFYTNVQQFYDSTASISGGTREQLFQES